MIDSPLPSAWPRHQGGASSSRIDEPCLSMYLRCKTASKENVPIQAEFSLALMGRDGRVYYAMCCPRNAFRRKRKGWPNFEEIEIVGSGLSFAGRRLDFDGRGGRAALRRGGERILRPRNALTVELYRLFVEANANTSNDDRSHDVDIGDGGGCDDDDVSPTRDTADVTFSIQDGEVMVRAHMLILKLSAPTLAPLCEGYADDGENATVPIMGINLILFADATNCTLLKERCIDFYVSHAKEVRRHPSYTRVRESAAILDEFMDTLLSRPIRRSSHSSSSGDDDDDVDYETMGVNLLRRNLGGRGGVEGDAHTKAEEMGW
ncbi:LOW QUALITY PROTEIN: hypothetical protein ACHAXA_000392 [Cyclostephanos tholiformis]|uniref:BTB domain-containing protein n=1 Tax=Cyclostephanos tholiformis TaxID=382380 RepID=A0ABD3R6T4_9STRA